MSAVINPVACLSQTGDPIPLPTLDDGVSRNFLDVAKRTVPLRMTPSRGALFLVRRLPRAAPEESAPEGSAPEGPAPVGSVPVGPTTLQHSVLIRALRKRDIRDQLWGRASPTPSTK